MQNKVGQIRGFFFSFWRGYFLWALLRAPTTPMGEILATRLPVMQSLQSLTRQECY